MRAQEEILGHMRLAAMLIKSFPPCVLIWQRAHRCMTSSYAPLVLQLPVKWVHAHCSILDDHLIEARACIWCTTDFDRHYLLRWNPRRLVLGSHLLISGSSNSHSGYMEKTMINVTYGDRSHLRCKSSWTHNKCESTEIKAKTTHQVITSRFYQH